MKRAALSLMLSFAVAGSLYAAQNPSSQPQPPASPGQSPSSPASPGAPGAQSGQKPADVTLTGCLVQGSGPNVFILEYAKASTDPTTAAGKSYVINVTGSADLKPHLNHQVRIVGSESAMGSSSSSSSPGASMSGAPGASAGSSSQPGSSSSAPSSGQPGSSSAGSSSDRAGQSGSSAGQSGSSSSQSAQSGSGSRPSATTEASFPRLNARTVTMVAATCPAA
jgi:hypothetical protein